MKRCRERRGPAEPRSGHWEGPPAQRARFSRLSHPRGFWGRAWSLVPEYPRERHEAGSVRGEQTAAATENKGCSGDTHPTRKPLPLPPALPSQPSTPYWQQLTREEQGLCPSTAEFRDNGLTTDKVIWSYYFQRVLHGLRINIPFGASCPLSRSLTATVLEWLTVGHWPVCVCGGAPQMTGCTFLGLFSWWKMARDSFTHCRGWKLEKKEWKGTAKWAGILGEGKELKAAGGSGPFAAFEDETRSRVVCFCLPGTSTTPENESSLDFHGAGMGLASMSLGYFRERPLSFKKTKSHILEVPSDSWQQHLHTRPCQPPPITFKASLPMMLRWVSLSTTLWLFWETECMMLNGEKNMQISQWNWKEMLRGKRIFSTWAVENNEDFFMKVTDTKR